MAGRLLYKELLYYARLYDKTNSAKVLFRRYPSHLAPCGEEAASGSAENLYERVLDSIMGEGKQFVTPDRLCIDAEEGRSGQSSANPGPDCTNPKPFRDLVKLWARGERAAAYGEAALLDGGFRVLRELSNRWHVAKELQLAPTESHLRMLDRQRAQAQAAAGSSSPFKKKQSAAAAAALAAAPAPAGATTFVADGPVVPVDHVEPGCFLIAHPLESSRQFHRSVILIVRENERSGTYGLILNRETENEVPAAGWPTGDALKVFSRNPLRDGGPITPRLQMIHSHKAVGGDCVISEDEGQQQTGPGGGGAGQSAEGEDNSSSSSSSSCDQATQAAPAVPPAGAPTPAPAPAPAAAAAAAEGAGGRVGGGPAVFLGGDVYAAAEEVRRGRVGAEDFHFLKGACRWYTGQLRQELDSGIWIMVKAPLSTALASDKDMWGRLLRSAGGAFADVAQVPACRVPLADWNTSGAASRAFDSEFDLSAAYDSSDDSSDEDEDDDDDDDEDDVFRDDDDYDDDDDDEDDDL